MAKCKCCGQEEVGYGTLLDKRGYCLGCSQYSINECEEQNARLKSELDKTIKQLNDYEKALKDYADMSNWFVCYLRHHFIFKKDNYKANELAKETLKKWENK